MHSFLHDIRQAFVRPVGACFGLPLKQEEEEEGDAEIYSLQPEIRQDLKHMGTLPPATRGEDEDADNVDLQPSINRQYNDGKGPLLPSLGDEDAENVDLHDGELLPISGVQNLAINSLLPRKQGDEEFFLKLAIEDDDGNLFTVQNFRSQYAIAADMHVQSACINGVAKSHPPQFCTWVKPIPRPRVKMKAKIKLFYMLTGMLDPGIQVDYVDAHSWGHDGCWESLILSPHHELLQMSLQDVTSSSALSLNASLSDVGHDDVLPAGVMRLYLPLTPLRGRNRYQGREMQDVEMKQRMQRMKMMPKHKLEIKTMKMQMTTQLLLIRLWPLYITKDILDLG